MNFPSPNSAELEWYILATFVGSNSTNLSPMGLDERYKTGMKLVSSASSQPDVPFLAQLMNSKSWVGKYSKSPIVHRDDMSYSLSHWAFGSNTFILKQSCNTGKNTFILTMFGVDHPKCVGAVSTAYDDFSIDLIRVGCIELHREESRHAEWRVIMGPIGQDRVLTDGLAVLGVDEDETIVGKDEDIVIGDEEDKWIEIVLDINGSFDFGINWWGGGFFEEWEVEHFRFEV